MVSLPAASEFGEIVRLRAVQRKNLGMPNYNAKTDVIKQLENEAGNHKTEVDSK